MGGYRKRAKASAAGALAIFSLWASLDLAHADDTGTDTCSKVDFESVVEVASSSLRDLNQKNRPAFQEKLRDLKAKRNWSHDEFIEQARPFVKDEKIAIYDQTTDELLSAIATMGQEGAEASTPDCALLLELRARMKVLVDTQTAKWSYMFEKIDTELQK